MVEVSQRVREAAAMLARQVYGHRIGNDIAETIIEKHHFLDAFAKFEADILTSLEKVKEDIRAGIINTPETVDFMSGVPLEAAHQRERWGVDHDAGKSPFDWFWLIGYLSQKAAASAVSGDVEKAKHHTISTAAALANWHAALTGADTRMRPGIDDTTLTTKEGE